MQPEEALILGAPVGREPLDGIVKADVAAACRAGEEVAANQTMLVPRTKVSSCAAMVGTGATPEGPRSRRARPRVNSTRARSIRLAPIQGLAKSARQSDFGVDAMTV